MTQDTPKPCGSINLNIEGVDPKFWEIRLLWIYNLLKIVETYLWEHGKAKLPMAIFKN